MLRSLREDGAPRCTTPAPFPSSTLPAAYRAVVACGHHRASDSECCPNLACSRRARRLRRTQRWLDAPPALSLLRSCPRPRFHLIPIRALSAASSHRPIRARRRGAPPSFAKATKCSRCWMITDSPYTLGEHDRNSNSYGHVRAPRSRTPSSAHETTANRLSRIGCPKCGTRPPNPRLSQCARCTEKSNNASRTRDPRLRATGMMRRDPVRAQVYELERSRWGAHKRRAAGLCAQLD